MVRVFISHSRYDNDIKNFFSNIFAHIGLQAIYMEWEDLDRKYAGADIMEYICSAETVAVLILLGRNLPFPPALWVIFIAGLAAGARKPLWVFEASKDNIKFPVPLVTDYVQFNLNNSRLREFGQLFRQQFMGQYEPYFLLYQPRIERCPYETCTAVYRFWSNSQVWHCPVCRRRIPRTEGSDTEGFFPIA